MPVLHVLLLFLVLLRLLILSVWAYMFCFNEERFNLFSPSSEQSRKHRDISDIFLVSRLIAENLLRLVRFCMKR